MMKLLSYGAVAVSFLLLGLAWGLLVWKDFYANRTRSGVCIYCMTMGRVCRPEGK